MSGLLPQPLVFSNRLNTAHPVSACLYVCLCVCPFFFLLLSYLGQSLKLCRAWQMGFAKVGVCVLRFLLQFFVLRRIPVHCQRCCNGYQILLPAMDQLLAWLAMDKIAPLTHIGSSNFTQCFALQMRLSEISEWCVFLKP